MPISFEASENSLVAQEHYHRIAAEQMRPLSRRYDDEEHALPREWVDWYWRHGRNGPGRVGVAGDGFVQVCIQAEELCWGDAGLYLRMPTPALGGSAVAAAGTEEQKPSAMPMPISQKVGSRISTRIGISTRPAVPARPRMGCRPSGCWPTCCARRWR